MVFRQTRLSAMTIDSPGDTSSQVPQAQHNQNQPGSGPQALSMAKVVQGTSVAGPANMRNFAQIMEDEKKQRNVLELKITKIRPESGPNPANLTYEDLGELLFDVLKVPIKDCVAFDYNTGRYDIKQVKMKPGVPVSDIIAQSPVTFKDHTVTVSQQRLNITRVTFKYVPLNVPDEEIINLCLTYGKPIDNTVLYERLSNPKNKGHTGSTRFVDMELHEGMTFNNYYWLEGPLPGDQGRRILVLHSGQDQQCSNCLGQSSSCPANGNGKLCTEMKTPRAKMSSYMNSLKISVGYSSLKAQYLAAQLRKNPTWGGQAQDIDVLDLENDEICPSNPLVKKDSKISQLENSLKASTEAKKEMDDKIAALEKIISEINSTKDHEVNRLREELKTANKKVDTVLKGSTNKLILAITDNLELTSDEFDSSCTLLASSAFEPTMTEEIITSMNTESAPEGEIDVFKVIQEQVDLKDPVQSQRFSRARDKVTESLIKSAKSKILARSPSAKRRLSQEATNNAKKKLFSEGSAIADSKQVTSSGIPVPQK